MKKSVFILIIGLKRIGYFAPFMGTPVENEIKLPSTVKRGQYFKDEVINSVYIDTIGRYFMEGGDSTVIKGGQ